MSEKLIPIRDFAQRLGIHPRTLRLWHEKKELIPAHQNTKGRFYEESQYEVAVLLRDKCHPGERTSSQVCVEVGICHDTLYGYIEKGFVSPAKRNHIYYFSELDVQTVKNCWRKTQ